MQRHMKLLWSDIYETAYKTNLFGDVCIVKFLETGPNVLTINMYIRGTHIKKHNLMLKDMVDNKILIKIYEENFIK